MFVRAIILIFGLFLSTGSAVAGCPEIGAPPRTITSPAKDYANSGNFSLDEDGILIYDYGEAYGKLGKYHNPYFISNYAGALYRDYLNASCEDAGVESSFLKQARWLLRSGVRRGNTLVWTYEFPNERFDLKSGWISGIGQARIAGILQRAYALTADVAFHEAAEAAMEVYRVPLKDGGVVTLDEDATWIEEAPHPGGISFKILNGHITALAGIRDFFQITKEAEWKEVFDRGVRAVERDISKFDAGFSSNYSLAIAVGRLTAPPDGYNALHVDQLLWLYDETSKPIFLEWASRFRAFQTVGDKYSAKGSVDPIHHGPDQAAGFYGSKYWSHSDFPTWLRVDMPESEEIARFELDSNGLKASPRDFTLSALTREGWREVYSVKGNEKDTLSIIFEKPILASAFRIDIESDNGNRNTAIQAAMPVRANPHYAPVANFCNWRTGNMEQAEDGNPETAMKVFCPGFIIVPMETYSRLAISASAAPGERFKIESSSDLTDWTNVQWLDAARTPGVVHVGGRYARISFDAGVTGINELSRME